MLKSYHYKHDSQIQKIVFLGIEFPCITITTSIFNCCCYEEWIPKCMY